MIRILFVLAAAVMAAGCAGAASKSDPEVRIRISNAGAEPLQCRMMFGHWVDRDLGAATRGGGTATGIAVTVQQQPKDGALFVMRDDGERRMMLENILCARPNDWQATVGQIDLAVVRTARPKEVWVSCALPETGGRVACAQPKLWYRAP
ncbi:hypothetical protein [Dongia sedimenti]|uniref:Lipoprotein n=1 Tax=Dongia sedimenti TaxID=3064282 RepID=A0ABU0YKR6_9PROT|nr:hypothetical protein [Rhodospirillaceae bacterium R-7]